MKDAMKDKDMKDKDQSAMQNTEMDSEEMEAQDAISLLTSDHERVQQLFQEFEEIKDDMEMEDEKADLVEQICMELTIHAQIEEEIFYPAMRGAIEEQDIIDEADVEHDTAKYLISQLESMKPGDDHYDAKVCVLGDVVNHHIQEEQDEMFSKAQDADIDLDELGQQLMERKQELMHGEESGESKSKPKSRSAGGKKKESKSSSHRSNAHH
ncbi:hemerythrin [Novimethylophilus kurashikiensis]|uniref:Hemerythrin n=1 Tax=Novimethylophilus kurashikiensis TaxID=1825523 RepID=A0A2R5FBW0_9PROT|nr:hemerythrin domain-containing protein [Novimethylophilus kurashikiensis]GBG15038.1 hemerythrin [Novimethylophilus kurashikiensis]